MSDELVKRAWQTLQAVYPLLPGEDSLTVELEDFRAAQARGYYLPDEDERIRRVYSDYLTSRAVLWEMIREIEPHLGNNDLRLFALAYCATLALVRSGSYLIVITRGRPVVHRKLDEAESRFGLPRKTFTGIFKNLTSPATAWRFREAGKFYQSHRNEIREALVTNGLEELHEMLMKEGSEDVPTKRSIWAGLFSYRLHSLTRRTRSGYHHAMFSLFQMSGEAIAGKSQPFRRRKSAGKRVEPDILQRARKLLQPGDLIVTRHDDALSNLFFPGYWPHAALFLGTPDSRKAADLPCDGPDHCQVLEAKKDGVKFRPLKETLSVDSFVIVRPNIEESAMSAAIERAITHEGKLYDFLFDFRNSDRLACTDLVYRAFHGIAGLQFRLVRQSGRLTLPAGDLIGQLLNGEASVIAIFGTNSDTLATGHKALKELQSTLVR